MIPCYPLLLTVEVHDQETAHWRNNQGVLTVQGKNLLGLRILCERMRKLRDQIMNICHGRGKGD